MESAPKRKLSAVVAILLVLIAGLAIAGSVVHKTTNCKEAYRDDTSLKINGQTLKAQIAKTDAQREQGLSGRACIADTQAMLFVFDKPGYYPFWMKDMRFPIDMVWLSETKQVVWVENNVSPSSYPSNFVSAKPARYVIELAAGQSQALNLGTGTLVAF